MILRCLSVLEWEAQVRAISSLDMENLSTPPISINEIAWRGFAEDLKKLVVAGLPYQATSFPEEFTTAIDP
jgi:hypothetical protein